MSRSLLPRESLMAKGHRNSGLTVKIPAAFRRATLGKTRSCSHGPVGRLPSVKTSYEIDRAQAGYYSIWEIVSSSRLA